MHVTQPPNEVLSPGTAPQAPPCRKALLITGGALVALILLIVVINLATSHSISPTATPSTTPSSSQAASSPAPTPSAPLTATVGGTFKVTDSSGNVYDVTLQKVIDPAAGSDQFNQPDIGTRFVAAVFKITGVSGTAKDDSNNSASLTGSNQQVYQPNFDSIAGYTNFNSGDFNVTPGQSEIGAVTFQVPSGVSAAHIQWTVGFSNSTATWNMP